MILDIIFFSVLCLVAIILVLIIKRTKRKQDSFHEDEPSFWTILLHGISGF
jgi:uncharacterized alpha/beta hydrolase family protein